MKCSKCETELAQNAKFCPECGTPAPKPEPQTPTIQEPKQFPPILTIDLAGEFLHVSRCNIYTLIKNEGLPYFPLGRDKRFITEEILQWAKNRQVSKRAV